VTVIEGGLTLRRIILELGKKVLDLSVDQTARPGHPARVQLPTATPKKTKKTKKKK